MCGRRTVEQRNYRKFVKGLSLQFVGSSTWKPTSFHLDLSCRSATKTQKAQQSILASEIIGQDPQKLPPQPQETLGPPSSLGKLSSPRPWESNEQKRGSGQKPLAKSKVVEGVLKKRKPICVFCFFAYIQNQKYPAWHPVRFYHAGCYSLM